MFFMLIVSFYTSRVILNALGIVDFGIYNVVGGVVAMFSLISGSLSVAISRFIIYELAKDTLESVQEIFSTSITIQLLLSMFIIMLAEIVGVWFLNTKLVIPADRLVAANWVFQLSIVAFVINLICVPYNAVIIAHEKMGVFAYISILEAVGKLTASFLITVSPIDRLVFYAISMCVIAIIIRFTYRYYCKRSFPECTYRWHWNKEILMNMFRFAGWNFIGQAAGILRGQGINILLNFFFGPIVNAAQGVALQVNNTVTNFSGNFLTAINPQITKTYSYGDMERTFKLVMSGSRFAFLLLLLFVVPILCETEFILNLWLKNVPDYAPIFVRLALILSVTEILSLPLITLQQATGKMRNYQILVGTLHMLNIPLSLILLRVNFFPWIVYIVAIILSIISMYARLFIQNRQIGISILLFHKEVISRWVVIGILVAIFITILKYLPMYPLCRMISSFFLTVLTILTIGIKKNEFRSIIAQLTK